MTKASGVSESRESRSLGSLGVLGVSGVSESQTVNCTIAQIINKVTIVALVWNDIQHFLFYVDQDKHVCDSSKLILFPHISQEFLLLLRLGFAPWAESPDIDLCKVFKRCQKKRVIKDYHLKLYLKNRGGNQATPIAIAFRSLLL